VGITVWRINSVLSLNNTLNFITEVGKAASPNRMNNKYVDFSYKRDDSISKNNYYKYYKYD